MTPDSQRIAIAEVHEWTTVESPRNRLGIPVLGGLKSGIWKELPDYLGDLNAIHAAVLAQPYEIRRTIAQNAVLTLMTEKGDTFDDALAIMFISPAKLGELLLRALGK